MLQKTNTVVTTALILDDHLFFGETFAVTLEHNGFVDAAFAFTDPLEIRKYIYCSTARVTFTCFWITTFPM